MKKRTDKQYAKILYGLTTGVKEKDLTEYINVFVNLLKKEQKIKHIDKIIKEFVDLSKKEQGIEKIEIITASKVSGEIVKKIEKIFGDKTESTEKLDKNILGGFIIKTENKILDASLKTQLKQLKTNLVN